MTIAQVGKQYGMTADTLRYYERAGLIPPVGRGAGGIRDYQEVDLRWVEFIQCMRGAGVSVDTLAEYVALVLQGDETAGARKALLIEQRAKLAERIDEQQRALARLDMKIESYDELMRQKENMLNMGREQK